MSRILARYFILSLIVIILCIQTTIIKASLNVSGDMVSNIRFNFYSLFFHFINLKSKCLKLKLKYPGLNCNELETSKVKFLEEDEFDKKYRKILNEIELNAIGDGNNTLLNISKLVIFNETKNYTVQSSSKKSKNNHKQEQPNKKKENLNEKLESDSLFSVKSVNDLKLNFDLNNSRLNETMETEEFLRMIEEEN